MQFYKRLNDDNSVEIEFKTDGGDTFVFLVSMILICLLIGFIYGRLHPRAVVPKINVEYSFTDGNCLDWDEFNLVSGNVDATKKYMKVKSSMVADCYVSDLKDDSGFYHITFFQPGKVDGDVVSSYFLYKVSSENKVSKLREYDGSRVNVTWTSCHVNSEYVELDDVTVVRVFS